MAQEELRKEGELHPTVPQPIYPMSHNPPTTTETSDNDSGSVLVVVEVIKVDVVAVVIEVEVVTRECPRCPTYALVHQLKSLAQARLYNTEGGRVFCSSELLHWNV